MTSVMVGQVELYDSCREGKIVCDARIVKYNVSMFAYSGKICSNMCTLAYFN